MIKHPTMMCLTYGGGDSLTSNLLQTLGVLTLFSATGCGVFRCQFLLAIYLEERFSQPETFILRNLLHMGMHEVGIQAGRHM